MPVVLCPNCREKMKVEPEDLGERVICPSCDHRFAARAEERDEDRPHRRSRVRSDDEDDRPKRKKSSNAWLYWILGIVAVVILAVCGGCIGFTVWVNNAKVTFAGSWTDHPLTATDGTSVATASFPMAPVTGSLNDSANSGVGQEIAFNNMDQQGSMKDAVFLLGYIDYPKGTTSPLDKGNMPIRNALTETHLANPLMAPRVASEKMTTEQGYPCKEIQFMDDDGAYTLKIVQLNDRPMNATVRLVVILAGGIALSDADKQKFLSSVKFIKGK